MKKDLILCSLLLFVVVSPIYSRKNFSPADSKILVGDELLNNRSINLKNSKSNKYPPVTNAPQAGAYYMIRFFQIAISPQDGARCKYYPTCSHYGKHAVQIHGALLGPFLAGDRILRCNPYTPAGTDHVPLKIFSE